MRLSNEKNDLLGIDLVKDFYANLMNGVEIRTKELLLLTGLTKEQLEPIFIEDLGKVKEYLQKNGYTLEVSGIGNQKYTLSQHDKPIASFELITQDAKMIVTPIKRELEIEGTE